MRRYRIKVNKGTSTIFNIDAKNKKEAKALTEFIINHTCILNLRCIQKNIYINYDISQIKGRNK